MVNNYHNMSASKLGKIMGLSRNDVSNFWYKAGLKGKQNRVYSLDEHCFDAIDNEYKAYVLGFIASDGCIHNPTEEHKQNIVKISIKQIDEEILNIMKTVVFKTDKPISHRHGVSTLEIVSDNICQNIIKLGLGIRKTYGNTYVQLETHLMRHFIRGYFDGDGSISTKCGEDSLTHDIGISISGFYSNLSKIANYLENFNIFTTITIDNRKYNGNEPFGALNFPNKISKYCFLKFIYDESNIFLQRKKNLAQNFFKIIVYGTKPMDKTIIAYYKNAVLKEYWLTLELLSGKIGEVLRYADNTEVI